MLLKLINAVLTVRDNRSAVVQRNLRTRTEGSTEIPYVHATKLNSWSGTTFMAFLSVRYFSDGGQGSFGEDFVLF